MWKRKSTFFPFYNFIILQYTDYILTKHHRRLGVANCNLFIRKIQGRLVYICPLNDYWSKRKDDFIFYDTGLHTESHGMVGNFMHDTIHGKNFLIGANPDQYLPFWWDDAEPVWVTAEKQVGQEFYPQWSFWDIIRFSLIRSSGCITKYIQLNISTKISCISINIVRRTGCFQFVVTMYFS